MIDIELRAACEEFLVNDLSLPTDHGDIEVLMAFARRMMAEGVRSAGREMRNRGFGTTAKDIVSTIYNSAADWCEAEAKRLEGE